MKIELSKYRINKPYIQEWVTVKKPDDIAHTASSLAIILSCPVIVVYHYLGEVLGFNEEILGSIERLKKFYQITEVVE